MPLRGNQRPLDTAGTGWVLSEVHCELRCMAGIPHRHMGSWTKFQTRLQSLQFPLHLLSSGKWGMQPAGAPLGPGGWCRKWGSPGAGGRAAGVR